MNGDRTAEIAAALQAALGESSLVRDPGAFQVDGQPAPLAVAPERPEDFAAVLDRAAREGWAVVPAGHGGWLSVGSPLRGVDLVLTTRRLQGPIEHHPEDLLATVPAGVTLAELNAELASAGQWWPLDPIGGGTLGAVIATGSAGPLATAYGTPRDHVLGLTVALADGSLVRAGGRVVKNVAGYDLVRLFTGSWGTLGVVTSAHLRLHPVPSSDRTLVCFAERAEPLAVLARTLAGSGALPPAAAEILSPAAAGALGIEAGEWQLALRWSGHEGAVDAALDRAGQTAADDRLRAEVRTGLWARIGGLEEALRPVLAVRVDGPLDLVEALSGLARTFAGGQTPALLAAPLVGRAWLYVSERLYEAAPGTRAWAARIEGLRGEVLERGGRTRIERAPGDLRNIIDVWGDPGPSMRLHRGLKEAFDPAGILNPGRFVGGV